METPASGHQPDEPHVESTLSLSRHDATPAPDLVRGGAGAVGDARAASASPRFQVVYDEHFAFVWRTVRRLGVPAEVVDDAVQDVFLVVHRRLADFEGRSSLRTWLFGICHHVVRDVRRAHRRRRAAGLEPGMHDTEAVEAAPDAHAVTPQQAAERAQAVARLYAVLDTLDEDKRALVVLADLEEMTVPEIAEALELNPNTVYSRLRAARHDFEQAVARLRARESGAAPRRRPWTT